MSGLRLLPTLREGDNLIKLSVSSPSCMTAEEALADEFGDGATGVS